MKLFEFFGRSSPMKDESKKETDKFSKDELFWFILDNDKLHKEHFFPLAKKIKEGHMNNTLNDSAIRKKFMPMVNKGCLEFQEHEHLPGRPDKLFSEELREELCNRLYDHYKDDIVRGIYKIG